MRARRVLSGLFWALCVGVIFWVVLNPMFGCAVGQTIDGQDPMIGFRLSDAGDAVQTALGAAGGALFGPPGMAIGTAIGGLIIGHQRGSRKGWVEKEEDLKKAGTA